MIVYVMINGGSIFVKLSLRREKKSLTLLQCKAGVCRLGQQEKQHCEARKLARQAILIAGNRCHLWVHFLVLLWIFEHMYSACNLAEPKCG